MALALYAKLKDSFLCIICKITDKSAFKHIKGVKQKEIRENKNIVTHFNTKIKNNVTLDNSHRFMNLFIFM